ncbi:adenylosuccinate lyase [Platysternon megacephalum]|uniref:DNA topoisomerase n=1 Tax=Platysternon megacephalum TaxID=55544 RepID=A0A4D9DI80_9SAUR|nr:adenylosuccinate lyase [Platysternon megacephalum]
MRLFIAEKPSLAAAIAAQLPGTATKTRTHIEVGNDIVTWCVGHILEQFMPEDYDASLKQWRAESLPIAPAQWKLKIKDGMQGQVKAIGDLLKKADAVVNAGDPDREGQLLVDEVLLYLGNRKPVQRVLVSDYNEAPVKKALASIKSNNDPQFRGWYESALARSRFDWLFGLNLTRAYTLAARRIGYEGVLSVGRVQTPTLGLVVGRDLAIENFKPIPFYTLTATVQHANGTFAANWRAKPGQTGLDDEGRLIDAATAQALATRLTGKSARIEKYEKKPANENAPLPFSLSSLQMAANDRYGLTAQQVLDICQALYETHKLTTYPRTDCNYLSEAQHADAATIIGVVTANLPELATVAKKADTSRKSPAFNDSKVTAHHAIVPTSRRMDAASLNDNERKVYDMVVRTYLAQFFPPSQFLKTDIEVAIDGEKFTAKGKTPVSAGWREIYAQPEPEGEDADSEDDDKQALPAMNQGDAAQCKQCVANNRKTTPPQRFTEKLLLAAMVDIHKYVDDPAAKARLKEGQGIGTEATRAGIIEELKKRGFIGQLKAGSKQIVSTPAGRGLIAALPAHAKNPALTGICEQALDMVAAGRLSGDDFIARNMQLITKLVTDASSATLNVPVAPTFPCPDCKTGQLKKRNGKNGAFWSCSNWNAEPKCSAAYDDFRGKPNFNPKPKGGFAKKAPAKKAQPK